MFYYLLLFLSLLESVIGFTLISSSVMRFKEPVKKRITAGLGLMLLGISLIVLSVYLFGGEAVQRYAFLYILAIEAAWFIACSGDRFTVSLFSYLSFVNIYLGIGFLSDAIAADFSGNAYVGIRILIRLILYLLIIPLLYRYVRPRFRKLVETLDKGWGTAALTPLLFLVLQTLIAYYAEAYWKWSGSPFLRYIVLTVYLLFFAVYYFMYIQAEGIAEKYALEKRQLLIAQQEKLWESELQRQKAISALAAQQRHDLHHHNAVVLGLLQGGETEKLGEYLKSFDAAIEVESSQAYCDNPIANSLLNHYGEKARKEGILMTIEAMIPEEMAINNVDLTCVLGNVLENALEGCLRVPEGQERDIDVRAKYLDRRLRIRVENTCATDIRFEGDYPITSKAGGGTGTRSIVYTAESYDGTAGFSLTDGRFVAQIVMNGK